MTENTRSPSVEEVLGMTSKCLSEERTAQASWYGTKFDIYDGACSFSAFHVNRKAVWNLFFHEPGANASLLKLE